jgi:hypothetical protein
MKTLGEVWVGWASVGVDHISPKR